MRRDGFALVLVLLVVGAIELITISTLALARHEAAAIAAQERTLAAARSAESAIRRLERAWPLATIDSLAIGQAATVRDSSGGVMTVRRIAWGQYLVTAEAWAGTHQIRQTALFETLDVERGMHEAGQVIGAAGPVTAPNAQFSVDPSTCSLPAVRLIADTLATAAPGYAFAGLSWNELASVADSGLVFATGSFTVPAGLFTGILAATGTLTLQNGADFSGIAIAGSDVIIEDNVRVTGALIVQGGGAVTVGAANLVFSPCQVARAMLQTPAARRLAHSQRRFIPAF